MLNNYSGLKTDHLLKFGFVLYSVRIVQFAIIRKCTFFYLVWFCSYCACV